MKKYLKYINYTYTVQCNTIHLKMDSEHTKNMIKESFVGLDVFLHFSINTMCNFCHRKAYLSDFTIKKGQTDRLVNTGERVCEMVCGHRIRQVGFRRTLQFLPNVRPMNNPNILRN